MKKFCDKITNQQWRVTVPNINTLKLSKSEKRISSASYDLEEAQKEFNLKGAVSQPAISISSSGSDLYENASKSSHNVYDLVKPTKREEIEEVKYEYDVPKIHFSFFGIDKELDEHEDDQNTYNHPTKHYSQENPNSHQSHRSEIKINVASQPIEVELRNELQIIKSSTSNPSLQQNQEELDKEVEEEEDNYAYYKVPKSIQNNRLSKSLHDFNFEDVDLFNDSQLSIDHISCSQIIPQLEDSQDDGSDDKKHTFLTSSRSKALDTWTNFKTKFSKIVEEHASHQKVGAFSDKDKIMINIEEIYKNSRDRCKKMFRSTGKIFKGRRESVAEDNSSQIVKNDAFFAKMEIKASDIEYIFEKPVKEEEVDNSMHDDSFEEYVKGENDLKISKNFRRSRIFQNEGQNGFDDLRRYIKQGSDFCKELSVILQERSDAEIQYSKSLLKLSSKLIKACRDGVGSVNEAWKTVALELEARAESHRQIGTALLEDTAKPLKTLTENQHRTRKSAENVVDKAGRLLSDWRAAEAKSKKQSHSCARENEKLQDAMVENRLPRSTSLIQLPNIHKNNSEKDNAKLEGKKRKAENAVKKADIEYYTHCVRSERARLEWESAVLRGATTFQTLEEERLNNLKIILTHYLNHNLTLNPKLLESTNKVFNQIETVEPSKDLATFVSLRQSSQQTSEQLLPDFYCEHITLAMNRERRKQALIKLLQLVKQDIDREKKSKEGLENLSKAIKQTPNFGAEDSQQTVADKMHHIKSMLTYLEGAKYKVQNALAELDCKPRTGHLLASHITITRDKAGLQQSVLKVPQWLRDQCIEDKSQNECDSDNENNWIDRGTADGNSNQPDSDFDEFSSQGSSVCGGVCSTKESPVQPIAQCKVIYMYTPNLPDELAIQPGDVVSVYRQQEDGWWLGECKGSVGIFPATYVENLPEKS